MFNGLIKLKWMKQIKENCCLVADKLFQNNDHLAVVLEDKNCDWDIEDRPAGSFPVSIFPAWQNIHLT